MAFGVQRSAFSGDVAFGVRRSGAQRSGFGVQRRDMVGIDPSIEEPFIAPNR
jgi:hypothetical protein